MKIGIDFDNTIVCYDRAFHCAALEKGWIPGELPATKESVKNHLISQGRNDDWTALQGYVYGPGIANATVFPGLREFLTLASGNGWESCVVSHKTKFPYRGPEYDLHASAQSWIEGSGLLGEKSGLRKDNIFFEVTKEAKLERAAELGVDVFVDDLPEILNHPAFPTGVRAILFDPSGTHPTSPHTRIRSWEEAEGVIRAS